MNQEQHAGGTVVYLSHGGGPLPILGDAGHREMVAFMKGLPDRLRRPDEILVISAHWEEPEATLIDPKTTTLLYDYAGFPPETYELEYPFRGNPELVGEIQTMLQDAGIEVSVAADRGYDHGVFIPLMLSYPEADIPLTQLSLIRGLDPVRHLALGKALHGLMQRNILVIGSGFSFHNMRLFFHGNGQDEMNNQFQDWLTDIFSERHDPEYRLNALAHWETAPNARHCHPREEHLLPLHVCAGMTAGASAKVIFDGNILGKRSVALQWDC